jgi:predicted CXXCH cytochrome family protein
VTGSRTRRRGLAVLSITAAALATGSALLPPARTQDRAPAATYIGAAACASCHRAMHAKWKAGRHSRMLQPASVDSVRGDFGRGTVTLRGQPYELRAEGGAWFIRERYLTGQPRERRVDYTLGNRRIQHYLTRLDDGRVVVLPPSWDVQRREWFHNLDIVDLEESGGVKVQVWNAHCHGCHVSGQERNFRAEKGTYDTRWTDFGTSCERCHGPGSRHAEPEAGAQHIVRASRLGAERETGICAQCHSLRDVVASGFTAGADYHDHFMPILEYAQKPGPDPAYWADGRPRRFSNDALGLWQSDCFVKGGATCLVCHDPHEPDVDRSARLAAADGLCLGCHPAVGRDVPAHTRHRADSAGSACVECHMPRTVFSVKAAIRDHAIGPPVPEATVRFGIPNACNTCHTVRSPAWARDQLRAWKADGSGARRLRRAEAFTGGRKGEGAALPLLLSLAADAGEPPLVRANAVGHLRRYRDPPATEALARALKDPSPVVRAVAALTSSDAPPAPGPPPDALRVAVGDAHAIVRIAAAFALMNRGVRELPGAEGRLYDEAKAEYVRRAALSPDDPATQLTLGQFLFLDRDYTRASEALEGVLRLRADQPGARYFLALSRLGEGRSDDARKLLARVPPGDPYAESARRVLKKLPQG